MICKEGATIVSEDVIKAQEQLVDDLVKMAQNTKFTMDKDLKTLFVFALRYALPRHTYAFDIVYPQILDRIQYFEDWEIEGMIGDCDMYYPDSDFGGKECDQPLVDKFKSQLQAELDRRCKQC